MFAFISNLLLFAAPAAGDSPFMNFWNNYMNYPGFEGWKFMNLAIFVLIIIWLLKKPLSGAFKAKREQIRAELIKAQQERDAAVKKLEDIEARLSMLDKEVVEIKEKAAADSEAEKGRIAAQTDSDIAKMREQAQNEINRAGQQARAELRKFSAEESIRLAEEMLRGKVGAETDGKLVKAGIDKLGGLN